LEVSSFSQASACPALASEWEREVREIWRWEAEDAEAERADWVEWSSVDREVIDEVASSKEEDR